MDVLHFLKMHHDEIRSRCLQLAGVEHAKERRLQLDALARCTQLYLNLEKDYLYPEITGLFSGAEALVAVAQANASVIDKRLKALTKLITKTAAELEIFSKRLAEFQEALAAHFDQEEQVLMPKMRLLIRTEDREDLGQVFVDVEAEVLASLASDHTPEPAHTRKRA